MSIPTAALCPSCSAPISELAILATAPVCRSCGVVLVSVGGTLGMMAGYGLSDPSVARRRVEADLGVLREYLQRYEDMRCACKEQLTWSVERYAAIPPTPPLLALKPLPSVGELIGTGIGGAIVGFLLSGIPAFIIFGRQNAIGRLEQVALVCAGVAAVLAPLYSYVGARAANGSAPAENARRQREHTTAVAAAVEAARPRKAAQDHRLRTQLRELESLIATLVAKEADVAKILHTVR